MNKVFIFLISVVLVCVSAWNIYESDRISGTYSGVVYEKAVSTGRSSTFYLYIDWGSDGYQSISVHPITYKLYSVGDRYSVTVKKQYVLWGYWFCVHTNTERF